jgi:hypothetical protein
MGVVAAVLSRKSSEVLRVRTRASTSTQQIAVALVR